MIWIAIAGIVAMAAMFAMGWILGYDAHKPCDHQFIVMCKYCGIPKEKEQWTETEVYQI